MRQSLLLILFVINTIGDACADTNSPRVLFDNGLVIESNELADTMNSPKALGFMFDDNPKTIWRHQKRDSRYEARRATLRIESSQHPITSVSIETSCKAPHKIWLTDKNNAQLGRASASISKHDIILAVDGVNELLVHFEDEAICIAGMRIYAGTNELTKDAAFIVNSGGGYATVSFFAQHKWVESFEPGNVTSYSFLDGGRYAYFVFWIDIGPLGGVRIYNTKTLANTNVWEGEYIEPSSIQWNQKKISATLVKPEDGWAKKSVSVEVSFP